MKISTFLMHIMQKEVLNGIFFDRDTDKLMSFFQKIRDEIPKSLLTKSGFHANGSEAHINFVNGSCMRFIRYTDDEIHICGLRADFIIVRSIHAFSTEEMGKTILPFIIVPFSHPFCQHKVNTKFIYAIEEDRFANIGYNDTRHNLAVRTPIKIAKDGRCECSCADTCAFGKLGSMARCTQEELESLNIPTYRV